MAYITVRLSSFLYSRTRAACARKKTPMATYLRSLLEADLDREDGTREALSENDIDRILARIERVMIAVFTTEELAVRNLDPDERTRILRSIAERSIGKAEAILASKK